MTTLKYGSTGELVKELQTALNRVQTALNRAGCNLTVDGVFGSKTTTAVKQFQGLCNLSQDGIVGAETWKALEPWRVSWDELAKAMTQVIKDMEALPSYKKFAEMMKNV